MKQITFHCETITPMFLAGADGKTPELRPSAVKGALRFWWRALNGNLKRNELKKKEAKIFGGFYTENNKDIALKSSVNINVSWEEFIPYCLNDLKKDAGAYNNKNSKLRFNKRGLEYFSYTLLHQKHQRDSAIGVSSSFKVVINSRNEQALNEAALGFWILNCLGGLGTRSRRGFGSFMINDIELRGIDRNKFSIFTKEDNGWKIKGIENLKNLNLKKLNTPKTIPGFSTLNESEIFIGPLNNSWTEVLNNIAIKVRSKRDQLYNKNLNFTQGELDKKASWGLPIQIFKEKEPVNLKINGELTRRASPLIFSIKKIDGATYWVVTRLNGKFMPNDSKITFKNREWDQGDPELINDFMEDLRGSAKQTIKL